MTLDIQSISKSFEELEVIKDLSLIVGKSEIICIVGPSGCGKSTLLNMIGGLIHPDAGRIQNNFSKIGYVFQEDRLLPWRTVLENIQLVNDEKTAEEINELLKLLDIDGFAGALPQTLSGGMRQRVAIARAFAYEADILLMDEPLKSLDMNLRINLIKLIHNIWKAHKCAVVYVTHEMDEALLLGDRILVMGQRPSKVNLEVRIDIPRSKREIGQPELESQRRKLLEALFA